MIRKMYYQMQMVMTVLLLQAFQIYTNSELLEHHLIDNDTSGIYASLIDRLNGSDVIQANITTATADAPSPDNILIKGPLVWISKAPRNMSDKLQELICTATGSPMPSISWSVNGQPIGNINVREVNENNEIMSVITLEYSHVPLVYICTASNAHGTSDAQIEITIEGDIEQMVVFQEDAPHNRAKVEDDSTAPSNLQWTSNANGDVTLFWEAPKTSVGPYMNYTVYLTENALLPLGEWRQLRAAQEQLKIPAVDLASNRTYYARVSAHEQNHITEVIAFSTPTSGPSGPPEQIRIEVDEAGNVIISWKKPQHINGDLEKYTLYFTRDPDAEDAEYKEWPSINILTSANEYSYKMDDKVGLKPSSVYRIRITATNNVAESKPSDVYEFESTAGENPVPTDIHVEVNNENNVVVRFSAVRDPEDHSTYIKEYDVFISSSLDAFVAQFVPVEASVSSFDEENGRVTMTIPPSAVSSNTRYWLKVQAHVPGRDVQSSKPRRFETGAGTMATTA